jgi:hypothetical protein
MHFLVPALSLLCRSFEPFFYSTSIIHIQFLEFSVQLPIVIQYGLDANRFFCLTAHTEVAYLILFIWLLLRC